jgi:UDP-glucose 4-epimerase
MGVPRARTVLVTGGGGFTGRHVVRRLVESGHTVVSYDRDYSVASDPSVIGVQGELFDIPRLMHVLQQHEVDAIVHTAAMSHPTLSLEFPVGTFAANVEGTLGVLEAARMAGVRRVVNFLRAMSTVRREFQAPLKFRGHHA